MGQEISVQSKPVLGNLNSSSLTRPKSKDTAKFQIPYRLVVVGSDGCGKSSIIKRIVSHRFDNLPTLNAEFMGKQESGRYASLVTVPPNATASNKLGPSQILLELQDQLWPALNNKGLPLLRKEALWYEVADTGAPVNRFTDARDVDSQEWGVGNMAAEVLPNPRSVKYKPPEKPHAEPHVLRKHLIEQAARASTASTVIPRDPGVINPLMRRYGTYGWVVTFDLGSVESFHVAAQMVGQLLQRVSTRPCPIAIMLVGNKQDQYGGRRMIVPRAEIFDLIRQGSAQDALVAQMRKQKLDRPLLRICDAIISLYTRSGVHRMDRPMAHGPPSACACISHTGPPCISQVRLRRGVGRPQGPARRRQPDGARSKASGARRATSQLRVARRLRSTAWLRQADWRR